MREYDFDINSKLSMLFESIPGDATFFTTINKKKVRYDKSTIVDKSKKYAISLSESDRDLFYELVSTGINNGNTIFEIISAHKDIISAEWPDEFK